MKKNVNIPIVFCFNKDRFFSAVVALSSILEHSNTKFNYVFYVLHSNLNDDEQIKLHNIIIKYKNCEIKFIKVNNNLKNDDVSLYKSWIFNYFNDYDKIILSSIDIVYLDDISKPYVELLDDYSFYIAGVKQSKEIKEKNIEFYSLKWDENEITNIFNIDENYNILNLKKIRDDNLIKNISAISKKNQNRIIKYDRDIFNIAFKDGIKYLKEIYKDYYIYYPDDDKPWNKVDNDLSAIWIKYIINSDFAKEFLDKLPITITLPNDRIVTKRHESLYRRTANIIPYGVRMVVKHPSSLFKREIQKRIKRKIVKKNYSLIIFDDVFPCSLSPFRYTEFMEYILDNKNTYFAVNGYSLPFLEEYRELSSVIDEFTSCTNFPKDHIFDVSKQNRDNSLKLLRNVKNPFAIFVFERNMINEVYDNLAFLEENNIPFIITLYPGGGLIINDKKSDGDLRRIFSSKCFRKVIVTQDNVKDYLLSKNMCNEKDIEYIFGIVTPESTLKNSMKKRLYYPNKSTLDICFVAHKYLPKGEDKGYDLFIESAKRVLRKIHNNSIKFHVIGGFNDKDIDVTEIKDNIVFYGIKSTLELDKLLSSMDVIISPTRPYILSKGSFDGFPTGSTTNAMLNGTLAIVSDELNLNKEKFIDNEEILIVKPRVNEIVEKIQYIYNNPQSISLIAKKGQKKAKKIYSMKNQIDRRLKLINKLAKNEYKNK